MGYLTTRQYLSDLRELDEALPEGWRYNTPFLVQHWEMLDWGEVANLPLFQHLVNSKCSINQMLYGPTYVPNRAQLASERKMAAVLWAEALEDEVTGVYCWHPHESGAYTHTMWARSSRRSEASEAIYAVDASESPSDFKNQFCDWVCGLERKRQALITTGDGSCSWQHGCSTTNGMARSISERSSGYWWSTRDRKWSRWGGELAGRKSRGKSLADKRKGITGDRGGKRCRVNWR